MCYRQYLNRRQLFTVTAMMLCYCLLIVCVLISSIEAVPEDDDYYTAVVVEYSPFMNASLDPRTNMLNNVKNYQEIISRANQIQPIDIIVFPEIGLRGYGNQDLYLQVPSPSEKVVPCDDQTDYDAPLVQLSCAARDSATYVVINLSEQFYNYSLHRLQYFNTDVVFDLHGAVVARYRKIHLYDENGKTPPMDKALVYFDTEFGVRFGVLTCFDIIFKDPGVDLADMYNISHFVFPTAWFSELPFLTAIQEQWHWSYTLDVVLLASGYNLPSKGSTGSGVYMGRADPLSYDMFERTGTTSMVAMIPKKRPFSGVGAKGAKSFRVENPLNDSESTPSRTASSDKLFLKRDKSIDGFSTQLITVPDGAKINSTGTTNSTQFQVNATVCQNTFCCDFSLNVTMVFNQTAHYVVRGDDFSQFYYRLAAFDGVRSYDHMALGGVQTCAIIPCVNSNLFSCGLRSDDSSSKPNMLMDYFQTDFIFESISITAVFSNNNSFVGPNVLLEGKGHDYGSLISVDAFEFDESNPNEATVVKTFKTNKPISNLVTASIYGRMFSRDKDMTSGVSTIISSFSAAIFCAASLIRMIYLATY